MSEANNESSANGATLSELLGGNTRRLHMDKIEIADTVHHKPTAEDWVVARVNETHLWPAGWPPGRANLADCELLEKATDAQREEMLRNLRKMPASDERHLPPNYN